MEPTKAIIKQSSTEGIYKDWLELTKPWHSLTLKELEVAALFIKSYIDNKDKIINDELLNNFVLSTENKRNIRKKLDMTPTYFQILLRGLRDKKFILDNKINKNYIPSFNQEGNIVLAIILKRNES